MSPPERVRNAFYVDSGQIRTALEHHGNARVFDVGPRRLLECNRCRSPFPIGPSQNAAGTPLERLAVRLETSKGGGPNPSVPTSIAHSLLPPAVTVLERGGEAAAAPLDATR
jgi:hypothetical protein